MEWTFASLAFMDALDCCLTTRRTKQPPWPYCAGQLLIMQCCRRHCTSETQLHSSIGHLPLQPQNVATYSWSLSVFWIMFLSVSGVNGSYNQKGNEGAHSWKAQDIMLSSLSFPELYLFPNGHLVMDTILDNLSMRKAVVDSYMQVLSSWLFIIALLSGTAKFATNFAVLNRDLSLQ